MVKSIDSIYYNLCSRLYMNGKEVAGTKELNNVCVTLHNIDENIVSIRDISPSYLFGEWLWYFTGRNSVEFISSFGSMWRRLSDDGMTNNSAYGYLMKYKFGFDQIEKIIELLSKDPMSRRAVINLNTPNERVIETKDEPCTIALQFLIRDGKLHCTGMMRSNDIWFGFPYDVAFFTELQKYIADRLKVGYGSYTHFVTSLHLYERNYGDIKEILDHPVSKPIHYDRVKFHENVAYMADMVEVASRHCSPDFVKTFTLKLAADNFDYSQEGVTV